MRSRTSRAAATALAIIALSLSAHAQQSGQAIASSQKLGTFGGRLVSKPVVLNSPAGRTLVNITGTARDTANGPLPNARLRLRDARSGHIASYTNADNAGVFSFEAVDPGTYVVEILGDNQAVLAASELIHVDAGEMVSTVVRLPMRFPLFGGLLGNSTPVAAATALTAAAAGAGILGVAVTGQEATPNGNGRAR